MPLVVYDAQLLAAATAFAGATYQSWPDVPPYTSNPEADCIGIVSSSPRHGTDFGLVLSRGLLTQVQAVLADDVGLAQRDIDEYIFALLTFARASGGSIVADPPLPATNPPHVEVPLELASRAGNMLVAAHPDLVKLGPRWGPQRTFVLRPRDFTEKVDAARRTR
ncbi:hypothetical protein ER308_08965 [Egibacter rhizosphaerae]|uniref:Uncharacterized protein n=1 Tax=Egibacter rhizosphaerae TaxID=1670831 RepID=A0A411YEZ4_9ACTN|nr:hypothetical protein [Egibacter rhizosphaerae]QBI19667.1 hypothetical protein ER308_08965 [Egibacter rhizosphaerae]